MKKFRPLYAIIVVLLLVVYGCDPREETKQPKADFNYVPTSEIKTGDLVTFTNLSTDAETYDWDFGDGTKSVAQHPTHEFDEAKEYNVTLVVKNKNLRDEISKKVLVISTVTACFTFAPSSAFLYDDVTFTNCSEGAQTYEWDFENDGTTDATTENPVYAFQYTGTYDVKLTAISGSSTDEVVHSITITEDNSVTACFTMSPNPAIVGDYVYFTNCSTGAESYEWDIDGDGIIDSYDEDPIFYYNDAGTYYAKLNAINGGVSDEIVHSITITEIPIVIDPTVYWAVGISDWNTEYFDDFSASGDWYEGSGADYQFVIANDYYTIIDNNNDVDHDGYVSINDNVETPADNYDLEVIIRNTVDNGNYGSGLLFGSDGADAYNYYSFSLGYYAIGDTDGIWQDWTSTSDGYSEDWNKLTVRKYDDKYYFFINEIYLYSDDYSAYGNKFGFTFDKNTTVDIDYVGVYTMIFSTAKSGNKKQQVNTAHGKMSSKLRNAQRANSPLK